ncbi:MAG: VanZ family protein, partial [Usitatibacteraceae bacterium]
MPTTPTPELSLTRMRMLRADRGALLGYALMLAYASLNPFVGWRWPEAFMLLTWPKYLSAFDTLLNVAAYIPFGAMLASLLRDRAQHGLSRIMSDAQIWIAAVTIGAATSCAFELLQAFLPARVSSSVDLLANTFGAAVGAALVLAAP